MRLDDEPPITYVFVGDEAEKRAAALTDGDGPILAVAPSAEWVGKAWPVERFAEVVRRLLARGGPLAGGRLMLLGDKADAQQLGPVRGAAARDLVIDLVGRADLLTSFAALKRARLYIGNDTGYSQLAAVAGVPTLVLFGPSDDRIWRPWGEQVRVVRGARTFEEIKKIDHALSAQVRHMIDLSADSVMAAAEALLEETEPAKFVAEPPPEPPSETPGEPPEDTPGGAPAIDA
jgi:ADP-heptose:LPS heptosyltransferase